MAELLYSLISRPPREILSIKPSASAQECCNLMDQHNIGALLVHEGKELLGLVSERDIVRNCLCKGLSPQTTPVSAIYHHEISILDPNDTVEKAMQVITKTKRRHILIQEGKTIVAIVSIGDLLFYLLEEKTRVIQHLENYIHS